MSITGNEKINIKLDESAIITATILPYSVRSNDNMIIILKIGRDSGLVQFTKPFKETSKEDLISFLKDIKPKLILSKCPQCGGYRLPNEFTPKNNQTICNSCKQEPKDLKMKNKGMKYRITSLYQPNSGERYLKDVFSPIKPNFDENFIKVLSNGSIGINIVEVVLL